MIEQNQFTGASADLVQSLTININAVVRKLQRRIAVMLIDKLH